jgi:hypothetical protein
VLLVVAASEVPYKDLLKHYHSLCQRVGPLPAPRVISVDHGRQRFLLFALDKEKRKGPCTAPAMAWFDLPVSGARVGKTFAASGWAFKDGVGLKRVEVLLDGKTVAEPVYGLPSPGTASFWRISTDPNHPKVGFSAQVDAAAVAPGRHWLGLRLHGVDGSVEEWEEQPVEISAD